MFKKDNDPWVRTFTVSDPTKHKKGYTLYKVISKVFPKNSIEAVTQVTVWKRYNDFKKLHKSLHTMHQSLYLQGTFPAFAKARFFGRFDDQVIEERRKCALELLEFSGKHAPLFTSQVFVKFFESGQNVDVPEEPEEKCEEPVMQPIVSYIPTVQLVEVESNGQTEDSEPDTTLGGIWQHHQVGDEISIGSQNATEGEDEEDDRTTFTDEDLSNTRTAFDLSEFDPVLNSTVCSSSTKSQDICNDWLLSAFQSCGTTSDKVDTECIMTFPKPFENHCFEDAPRAASDNLPVPDLLLSCTEPEASVPNLDAREFDPLYEPALENGLDAERSELCQSDQESSAAPYLLSAGKCISAAQEAEASLNFLDAFTFYKTAVDILLHGVQSENCKEQNEAIRHKILAYLKRAEELYETYLTEEKKREDKPIPADKNAPNVLQNVVPEKCNQLTLRRPTADLAKYRVIGVLSRVLLVLNTLTNTTCVVKVLRKSPYSQQQEMPSVAPQGVSFMVQLYEVYETMDAIYLILEYASGGRLWDYISSYLQRSPLNPADYDSHFSKQDSRDLVPNVYSGRKISCHAESSEIPSSALEIANANVSASSDLDLTAADNYPSSYLALFKSYMDSSGMQNAVPLAKYSVRISNLNKADDTDARKKCEPIRSNIKLGVDQNFIENIGLVLDSENLQPSLGSFPVNHDVDCVQNNSKSLSKTIGSALECVAAKVPASSLGLAVHCDVDTCDYSCDIAPCSMATDLKTFLCGGAQGNFTLESNLINAQKVDSVIPGTGGTISQPKVFSFTEVFHQMDTALSTATSKPVHLPEYCVVLWAAEIITALSALHKLGIHWQDLNPENILLGSEGHVLLTYESRWNCVHRIPHQSAKKDLYCAPEIDSIFPVTSACDWWSVGAILFELLTGKKLVSCHPVGVTSHTTLSIPCEVSLEASDLLRKLLTYNPDERLGSGIQGIEDLKCHPFFQSVNWSSLKNT